MSEMRGGAAAKAGNFYEALWGVDAMLDLLDGRASQMRIEPPHSDGEEFWIARPNGETEHWQCKRQIAAQKTWTLRTLSNNGVLAAFLPWLTAKENCVFASISDAPELDTLARRARKAVHLRGFKKEFLAEPRWAEEFGFLLNCWSGVSEEEALHLLRRVFVQRADDYKLDRGICRVLELRFKAKGEATLNHLLKLYGDSVHETLTAESVYQFLEELEVERRETLITPSVRVKLAGITRTYVSGQRVKLVGPGLIPRAESTAVVSRITSAKIAQNIVITGPAGTGKSGCLLEIVEKLIEANVPVLAFRLDRQDPVPTTAALGKQLDLSESPALVFEQAFPGQKIVLALDQLDCVSTTSGRHPDFFDTVAALIEEVRALRSGTEIHLIASCRQFDFENDSRLRSLLKEGQSPVELGQFSDAEVKETIRLKGGDPNVLTEAQLKLLRLPQNLSLFIDAGLARTYGSSFINQTQLFDLYWKEKHRILSKDWPGEAKEWQPILFKLAAEMNASQKLSVPQHVLGEFSAHFVEVMGSAGVLSFEKNLVGFSHESFFDYCFARMFAIGERELSEFLESDPQHLFRRAQTRQVLVFLRESRDSRYLQNVRSLLGSTKIRFHLKLLILELVASFPDSLPEEWEIFRPFIDSELACIERKQRNADRLASRAFDVFRSSRSMFRIADSLGVIESWLRSRTARLEEVAIQYLHWQAHVHADRVAELLEPFAEAGGPWLPKLRYIMTCRDVHKSRRLFDLFLKLLEKGALDDSPERPGYNDTFWGRVHGLAEARPDWCAELAGRWLDHKVAVATERNENDQPPHVALHDHGGELEVALAASTAPESFVNFVLKRVLHAAETTRYPREGRFPTDSIWQFRMYSDIDSLTSSYLEGCSTAIAAIARSSPDGFDSAMKEVRESLTDTANFILLNTYLTVETDVAEEVMRLLYNEPDRLKCGFSGNAYWISMRLIEKFSPLCSVETFSALERNLANFEDSDEERRERVVISLMSKLDATRTSAATKALLASQNADCVPRYEEPMGVQSFELISPLDPDVAAAMTDAEWLAALENYSVIDKRHWTASSGIRPDAEDMASLLQKATTKEPERFAKLALKLDNLIPCHYHQQILYALVSASIPSELKIAVTSKAFDSEETGFLIAALRVISGTGDIELSDDVLNFIQRMAAHTDPSEDRWQPQKEGTIEYVSGDILSRGVNSVRGRVAETIRDLINKNQNYIDIFAPTIEALVEDKLLSVRACTASTLRAVAVRDPERAIVLFGRLADANDVLRATTYAANFVQAGLQNHFPQVSRHIETMMNSESAEVRQIGARLASIAEMIHPENAEAMRLAAIAVSGDYALRLGAVEIAEIHVASKQWRQWCEKILVTAFDDENTEVRKKAAHCFWHLHRQKDIPLVEYSSLIDAFQTSSAFVDDPSSLLHALGDSTEQLPSVVLQVCENFVRTHADEHNQRSRGEYQVSELVFRAYQQLAGKPKEVDALNLIDRLCAEGIYSASRDLSKFER